TRGDRPFARVVTRPFASVPPHTRGSTLEGCALARCVAGSPAHAGIDPFKLVEGPGGGGFPRTRGDRPSRSPATARRIWVPPHTRGSTQGWRPHPLHPRGSPAHAGIDRIEARIWRAIPGFPRTRG